MVCEHEQLMLATTGGLFIPFFYTDAMLFGRDFIVCVCVYKMKRPRLFLSTGSHPAKTQTKIPLTITRLQSML